jgi:hypothetical protein
MTESDIAYDEDGEEIVKKDKEPHQNNILCQGKISNNYFSYQPVTLNQIEEAKSGEESKEQSENQ